MNTQPWLEDMYASKMLRLAKAYNQEFLPSDEGEGRNKEKCSLGSKFLLRNIFRISDKNPHAITSDFSHAIQMSGSHLLLPPHV